MQLQKSTALILSTLSSLQAGIRSALPRWASLLRERATETQRLKSSRRHANRGIHSSYLCIQVPESLNGDDHQTSGFPPLHLNSLVQAWLP